MEMNGQLHVPAALPSENHLIGDWVGLSEPVWTWWRK